MLLHGFAFKLNVASSQPVQTSARSCKFLRCTLTKSCFLYLKETLSYVRRPGFWYATSVASLMWGLSLRPGVWLFHSAAATLKRTHLLLNLESFQLYSRVNATCMAVQNLPTPPYPKNERQRTTTHKQKQPQAKICISPNRVLALYSHSSVLILNILTRPCGSYYAYDILMYLNMYLEPPKCTARHTSFEAGSAYTPITWPEMVP